MASMLVMWLEVSLCVGVGVVGRWHLVVVAVGVLGMRVLVMWLALLMLACSCTNLPVSDQDTVSEWLRRWTRNPLGSARRGSNPFGVVGKADLGSQVHLL